MSPGIPCSKGNPGMLLCGNNLSFCHGMQLTMEPNLALIPTVMDTLGHSASRAAFGRKDPKDQFIDNPTMSMVSNSPSSTSRIVGKKTATRPFKEFYEEWIETLKNKLLPMLQRSMLVFSASHLSTCVQMLHHHFQTYYYALDQAASEDISQLLYPCWKNSFEKPFLWFGDYHPYLFTNLLRSLLNEDSDDGDDFERSNEKGLSFPLAWNRPSTNLVNRVEQIECGLRSMVPCFVDRARKAQCEFIKRGAVDWVRCKGKEEASKVIGGGVVANNDELVSVFLDANRLRRNILIEIMGATDLYQAALYLEGLAKFFIGFRDFELVKEFEQCKIPLSLDS
ncbi:hypothetical protein IFM89_031992 [Coptis chinensis]|uniref:DOG1 domain-containing protein n=1 Tax=Coptis chinensis TaxID=261450 RepID=A0A835IFH0_9MAGN|nr:hypothetical protein IFM89_031992 [Coptis chinensis]